MDGGNYYWPQNGRSACLILGKPGIINIDFYVELISGFQMTPCNKML